MARRTPTGERQVDGYEASTGVSFPAAGMVGCPLRHRARKEPPFPFEGGSCRVEVSFRDGLPSRARFTPDDDESYICGIGRDQCIICISFFTLNDEEIGKMVLF